MFGRSIRSHPNPSDERNGAYGQPPATKLTQRSWAPNRRQLRGQIDLVREILAGSPRYF